MKKESKKESLKVRAKRFWDKNKGPIVFIAGTIGGVGAITLAAIGCKKIKDAFPLDYMDEYEPVKLFDKTGKEVRLFKWDSGTVGDPLDMIYYPECQVTKDVDWDKL